MTPPYDILQRCQHRPYSPFSRRIKLLVRAEIIARAEIAGLKPALPVKQNTVLYHFSQAARCGLQKLKERFSRTWRAADEDVNDDDKKCQEEMEYSLQECLSGPSSRPPSSHEL
jgi:hypothetical protein